VIDLEVVALLVVVEHVVDVELERAHALAVELHVERLHRVLPLGDVGGLDVVAVVRGLELHVVEAQHVVERVDVRFARRALATSDDAQEHQQAGALAHSREHRGIVRCVTIR
jgi:hypothetical protein